ncbi:uncharacterized protein CEXT_86411 [Caerostris extrusa]|uniref:Uncharacterized protein n=1 Tax=Caerostris extrusa TaxID=172846 RepID=A0AAV4V3G6_CAEEX|nr:uncharacterized protein CEXT_86411 [Caerostris extrusa]
MYVVIEVQPMCCEFCLCPVPPRRCLSRFTASRQLHCPSVDILCRTSFAQYKGHSETSVHECRRLCVLLEETPGVRAEEERPHRGSPGDETLSIGIPRLSFLLRRLEEDIQSSYLSLEEFIPDIHEGTSCLLNILRTCQERQKGAGLFTYATCSRAKQNLINKGTVSGCLITFTRQIIIIISCNDALLTYWEWKLLKIGSNTINQISIYFY